MLPPIVLLHVGGGVIGLVSRCHCPVFPQGLPPAPRRRKRVLHIHADSGGSRGLLGVQELRNGQFFRWHSSHLPIGNSMGASATRNPTQSKMPVSPSRRLAVPRFTKQNTTHILFVMGMLPLVEHRLYPSLEKAHCQLA
jgi:hypothetical protein